MQNPSCGTDPGLPAAISEIDDCFRRFEGFADLIELVADDGCSVSQSERIYLVAACMRTFSQNGVAQAQALAARVSP